MFDKIAIHLKKKSNVKIQMYNGSQSRYVVDMRGHRYELTSIFLHAIRKFPNRLFNLVNALVLLDRKIVFDLLTIT